MYRLLNRHLIFDHFDKCVPFKRLKYHNSTHASWLLADNGTRCQEWIDSKEENIHSILCASIWNVTLDSWFVQSTNLSRFDCVDAIWPQLQYHRKHRVRGMRLQVRLMHISIRHTMKFKRRNKHCEYIVKYATECYTSTLNTHSIRFFISSSSSIRWSVGSLAPFVIGIFVLKVLQNAMTLWILLIHVR